MTPTPTKAPVDLRTVRVDDVMTRHVHTTGPDVPVSTVAAELTRWQVTALPVLDARRRVVGTVSEGDVLRCWVHDRPGTGVSAVMHSPAQVISPGASAEVALAQLVRQHGHSLPVVFAGVLVGVVSRGDLLAGLAGLPRPELSRPGTTPAPSSRPVP